MAPLRSSYEIKPIHLLVDTAVAQYGSEPITTVSIHTPSTKAQNVNSVGSYQYTSVSLMLTTKTVTGGTMIHLTYKLFALTVTD